MFLDPMKDCPDKLIWALCGWLAWCDTPSHYEEALTELKELIDNRLGEITKSNVQETK